MRGFNVARWLVWRLSDRRIGTVRGECGCGWDEVDESFSGGERVRMQRDGLNLANDRFEILEFLSRWISTPRRVEGRTPGLLRMCEIPGQRSGQRLQAGQVSD